MPAPARFRAIVPKNQVTTSHIEGEVRNWFKQVAEEFREEMQKYPPKLPWKNGFPKKGPRRQGRRTGVYKHGWSTPPRYTKASVTVINPVTYSRFVGGPLRDQGAGRQARHMAARGWPSQSVIGPMVVRRNTPELIQAIIPYKNRRQ